MPLKHISNDKAVSLLVPKSKIIANKVEVENATRFKDGLTITQCNQPVVHIDPYNTHGPTLHGLIPHISIQNDTCLPMEFSLKPLPKTALACHPGSGTTWTRFLIQQFTGTGVGLVLDG